MTANSISIGGANRSFKIVVVGDGTVGKTCLLISFTTGRFQSVEYVPAVFENEYERSLECDGTNVNLTLWDTAGQEDYDRLRPLSYPGADIFLLCFSVDNVHSFQNITAKWQPEVNQHCSKAPYILVGTKTDLRPGSGMNHSNPENAQNMAKEYITKSMGRKLANKIKAVKYVECSAKNMTGITEVFKEAVRALIAPQTKRSCILL